MLFKKLRKVLAFRMKHVKAFQFLDQEQPLYLCDASTAQIVNSDEKQKWVSYMAGKKVVLVSFCSSLPTFIENAVRNKKLECFIKSMAADYKLKFSTMSVVNFDQNEDAVFNYKESVGIVALENLEIHGDCNSFLTRLRQSLLESDFENVTLSALKVDEDESSFTLSCFDQSSVIQSYDLIEAPCCHPAFAHRETNSVCHDIEMILGKLEPFKEYPEVIEIKRICLAFLEGAYSNLPLKTKCPVVVIEGLDATGKTTLTSNLAKKCGAKLLKSPPENVTHLRQLFDKFPAPLRRLYFFLSNYVIAAMMHDTAQSKLVVCDRFWHSSAAYAIATDVKIGDVSNLPPINHWVYEWPRDLLKPDVVYYLHVDEKERMRRLTTRDLPITEEERWLVSSRERVAESFCRMKDPSVVKVNASGTPDEVCQFVQDDLKLRNLL